jgi:hypothetical protein
VRVWDGTNLSDIHALITKAMETCCSSEAEYSIDFKLDNGVLNIEINRHGEGSQASASYKLDKGDAFARCFEFFGSEFRVIKAEKLLEAKPIGMKHAADEITASLKLAQENNKQ